jgi:hypothetical protein
MKKKLPFFMKIALIAFLALSASLSYGQIIIYPVTDSIAQVSVLYSYQLTFAVNGSAPVFTLPTKPAGMAINSSTGLITWTPASLAVGGRVVVQAHNNTGDYYRAFNIYITDAVVCDTSIISYWPLDAKVGTSVPEVIHGYDGLWQGAPGPEPIISTDGMVGNSVKFNPMTNEDWGYNVTDVNQYEFKGHVEFSVSFWFKNKPSSITPPLTAEVMIGRYCGATKNNAGWYIQWNPATEHVEFLMKDNGPTDTLLVNPAIIAQDDESWHHVVATFYAPTDLANYSYMHLFVDGVPSVAMYDFWLDGFDGTESLYLGYYWWGLNPYSGLLDEVAIWKKELLQADVNALHSRGLAHQPVCSEGNTAPIITSTAVTAATQDVAYSYTLTYSEIDGDPITRSAPVLPSWLNFNTTTGVLSGTPANSNVGDNNVTLRVSDGSTNVDQVFVIAVANVNDPPVITSTPGTSVDEDVAYTYTITATDVDAGATLTFSAPVLPSWMSFNTTTHVLSGTPTNAQVGHNASADFNVTLRVTDNASASDDQSFTITVNQVNDAPLINSQNSLSVNEDNSLFITTADLNVTDVDNTYPDDFTLTVKNGSNYTHIGNTIYPAANWNGVLTVPIDLTDGTATVSFDLSVTVNAINDAPEFTSDPLLSIVVGQEYQYWINTSDIEGSPRTLTCPTKPSWLSFSTNAGNGILQGTPAKTDAGNASVTLQVTDGSITVDQTFTIEVIMDNYAPVVSSTPDASVNVDELYTYTIVATDQDEDVLTYSAPTKPTWLTFNATTHVLSGIPGTSSIGANNVVLEVTDGKEPVQQSFTITVVGPNAIGNHKSQISMVYPVPSSDYVTFEFATKLEEASLEIYTTKGDLVKKLDISYRNSYRLDVTGLKSNNYIYRISTSKGQESGPLVIE